MATANIGIVSPVNKGAWDITENYNRLNIVHHSDGATYQAIQTVSAADEIDISNTSYWMQLTPKAPTFTAEDVAFDAGGSVENTGTAMAPALNFKVPRGVTGNESIDDTAGEGDNDVVWSADKSARGDLEMEAKSMAIATPPFFNLLDKTKILKGKVLQTNGTVGNNANRNTFFFPIDNTKGTRVRMNYKFTRSVGYDSTMTFVRYIDAAYAIDISGCAFVGVSFSTSHDPDAIMAAYTDETSHETSDDWRILFPLSGYVPYWGVQSANIFVDSDNPILSTKTLKYELDRIHAKEKLIGDNFDTGFNLYDGTIYRGKIAFQDNNNTYGFFFEDNELYDSTGLIRVDPTKSTRIRVKGEPYRIMAYDENLGYVNKALYRSAEEGNLRFPKMIDIAGATYVCVSFLASDEIDPDELMVTYSNGSGLYGKEWEDEYPNMPYQEYKLIPKTMLDKDDRLSKEFEKNLYYYFGNVSRALEGDGYYSYTISGSASNQDIQILEFPIQPCQIVEYSFLGQVSESDDVDNLGCYIRTLYYNGNTAIGSYTPGYITATDRMGYHRYTSIAPFGANKAKVYIYIRQNTAWAKIKNFRIRIMDHVAPRENVGLQIDGHLGVLKFAPQNTLPALELSKALGYRMVIVNAQPTLDEVLVCVHNWTIDAYTNDGTGNVNTYTYAQLANMDFGSKYSAVYAGTKIMTFEEAAKYLSANGMGIGTSLHKDKLSQSDIDEVCRIYKKYAVHGNNLVKSGDYSHLTAIYEQLGDSVEYMLTGVTGTDGIDLVAEFPGKCTVEFFEESVTDELIAYALNLNLPVSIAVYLDQRKMKKYINKGVLRYCSDSYHDNVFPV